MLKLLLKKQLLEVFKGYFYDAKKNKSRSAVSIVLWFLLFAVLMVVVLGGMFTGLSIMLCDGLIKAGMNWLYFALMAGIAIMLGAFGSVFNTYAGLYLSRDNELLLSMPIPVKYIVASRLLNVYLLGSMYSLLVLIPATVVYWLTADLGFMNGLDIGIPEILCGLLLMLLVTVIVLILSCLLGWVVAKISVKLKNKSFITVLVALGFLGGYYFFYFRAQSILQDLLLNAAAYGSRIKGSAYLLYLFGRVGCGDWTAAAIWTGIVLGLMALTWFVLKNTFLAIAVSGSSSSRVRYREKEARLRTPFSALVGKEFAKFTSSANYMLNCGLSIVLMPVVGVLILMKGTLITEIFEALLPGQPGAAVIALTTSIITLAAMVDTAAPSVSLEGKSLWIPQSMPVTPKQVLRSKALVQLILAGVPTLFTAVCAAIGMALSPAQAILMILTALSAVVFLALLGTFLGIRFPTFHWTNELAPIKQSASVAIALFGCWLIAAAFAALYFLAAYPIGAAGYLAAWLLVFLLGSAGLLRWLDTRGAARFEAL